MAPDRKWRIRISPGQLPPQAPDMAAHRIALITDGILNPYLLINLAIGQDIPFVYDQKAKKVKFLYHKFKLHAININLPATSINFKF